MARDTNPELKELWDKGIDVYSITRLDTINHCMAEAKYNYIDHLPKDENVYSFLGSKIHDKLEQITNGVGTKQELLPTLNNALNSMDMFGIKFPASRDGSDSIRTNYIEDMENFCLTYDPEWGDKLKAEQFVLYKTSNGNYCQGYIDLIEYLDDKTINIYDYKTSSRYSKADIESHRRQLIVYAMAMEQKGYKVNQIAWIFLKYAQLKYYGYKTSKSKEKSLITKVVERRKIGEILAPLIEENLKQFGYDPYEYITKLLETNSLIGMPAEILKRYEIHLDIEPAELSGETKQECINYIDDTIEKWNNAKEYPPKDFYKYSSTGKKSEDIFYCACLCDFSDKCEYYKAFRKPDLSDEERLFD